MKNLLKKIIQNPAWSIGIACCVVAFVSFLSDMIFDTHISKYGEYAVWTALVTAVIWFIYLSIRSLKK